MQRDRKVGDGLQAKRGIAMAIKSRELLEDRKIEIDLTGPDGNAFALLGYAMRLCVKLGKEIEPIQEQMMSGDYENLVAVFDREFGNVVTLYR